MPWIYGWVPGWLPVPGNVATAPDALPPARCLAVVAFPRPVAPAPCPLVALPRPSDCVVNLWWLVEPPLPPCPYLPLPFALTPTCLALID